MQSSTNSNSTVGGESGYSDRLVTITTHPQPVEFSSNAAILKQSVDRLSGGDKSMVRN